MVRGVCLLLRFVCLSYNLHDQGLQPLPQRDLQRLVLLEVLEEEEEEEGVGMLP